MPNKRIEKPNLNYTTDNEFISYIETTVTGGKANNNFVTIEDLKNVIGVLLENIDVSITQETPETSTPHLQEVLDSYDTLFNGGNPFTTEGALITGSIWCDTLGLTIHSKLGGQTRIAAANDTVALYGPGGGAISCFDPGSGFSVITLSAGATGYLTLSAVNDLTMTGNVLNITDLPTYADNAAAISGGLAANRLYKTATGEVRIVV